MVNFEILDYKDWEQFRLGSKQHISNKEFELVCQLHAKYHKHRYYKPCTCNPKTINKWIKELNVIWNNGDKKD